MVVMVLGADQGGRWREVHGEEGKRLRSLSHMEIELMVASPEDIEDTGRDFHNGQKEKGLE